MALNKLGFRTDTFGHNSFIRNPPLTVINIVLDGGEQTLFVPPAGTTAVIFSSTGEFWVKSNVAARVPEANTDSGAELNPLGYEVGGELARLSITAPRAIRMSIACYA